MGCGISKFDEEAARPRPTCTEEVKTLLKQSDCGILCEIDGSVRQKEGDSSAGCDRKSISSATNGRDFLKRVVGSDEKERGAERDIQPGKANSRKSTGKQEGLVQNVQDVRDQEQMKKSDFDKDLADEEGFDQEKSPDKVMEKEKAITDDDENPEEDSILFNIGSPSFRVYCVDPEYEDTAEDNNSSKVRREDKLFKEKKKESETMTRPMKREGKRRFRSVLQRGGSTGMKSLWIVSHRIHNYYFLSNQEAVEKSSGKTA